MNPTQQPARRTLAVTVEGDLTPADVLRCAALYLRRHGLHQGDMFAHPTRPYPAACAQGAIRMATCGSPTIAYTVGQAAVVDAAITILAEHLGSLCDVWDRDQPGDTVAAFNDQPGRTACHVIAALTAAAERWDRVFGGGR